MKSLSASDLKRIQMRALNSKCSIFGNMFKRAYKENLDVKDFIRKVMTNKKLEEYLVVDDRFEWADECVLLYFITHNFDIKLKYGNELDDYFFYFAGYLYKYWMTTRNMKPSEVYKIMPIQRLEKMFDFYHTQDWDYIINDATEQYKEGKFIE